jgi:hypothetical protein
MQAVVAPDNIRVMITQVLQVQEALAAAATAGLGLTVAVSLDKLEEQIPAAVAAVLLHMTV